MGNWRTVNITGTMSEHDAGMLREYLGYTHDLDDPAFSRFGPLSFNRQQPGIFGLNDWVSPSVSACGNLAERDYSVEDVAEELRKLVAIAGTLLLKVHCGGDYESDECIATISVGEGLVVVGKPEVERVEPVSDGQAQANLLRALMW